MRLLNYLLRIKEETVTGDIAQYQPKLQMTQRRIKKRLKNGSCLKK